MRLTGRSKLTCNGKARTSRKWAGGSVAWLPSGPSAPEPHPELGAETLATHRRLVQRAASRSGATAEDISERIGLPVWNVRRHLHALGLGPVPVPNPKVKDRLKAAAYRTKADRADQAYSWLKKNGPATAGQIARACCLASATAAFHVMRADSRFKRKATKRLDAAGRPISLWAAA